jgi:hypothetical protein
MKKVALHIHSKWTFRTPTIVNTYSISFGNITLIFNKEEMTCKVLEDGAFRITFHAITPEELDRQIVEQFSVQLGLHTHKDDLCRKDVSS